MGFFSRFFNQKEVQTSNTATAAEAKLLEWLGIDSTKPEAIQETTYFTCLKILSETMGKLPLKLYVEDAQGGRVNAERTS